MRKREVIEKDGTRVDMLTLEVLLDIRDLLDLKNLLGIPVKPPQGKRPRGRPKKNKI